MPDIAIFKKLLEADPTEDTAEYTRELNNLEQTARLKNAVKKLEQNKPITMADRDRKRPKGLQV